MNFINIQLIIIVTPMSAYLEATIQRLSLKTKFPSKVTVLLKHHKQQATLVDQMPLNSNPLIVPTQQIPNLIFQLDPKSHQIDPKQKVSVAIYLHSQHGKLLISSLNYPVNELKNNPTRTQKLKNAPDKNAEIVLTLKPVIKSTSNKSINGNEKADSNPFVSLLKGMGKTEEKSEDSSDKQKIHSRPAPVRNSLNHQNGKAQSKRIPLISPTSPRSPQPNTHLVQLKTKLSEAKIRSDKEIKLQQQLTELERQLRHYKEQTSELQVNLRLKDSSLQHQAILLEQKQEKIQALDLELRERTRRSSGLEQRNRELDYKVRHLTAQNSELTHNNGLLSRRIEKRQEHYRQQVAQLTQKYQAMQKQNEELQFKGDNSAMTHQDMVRKLQGQFRQTVRKMKEGQSESIKKLAQQNRQLQNMTTQRDKFKKQNDKLNKQTQTLKKRQSEERQRKQELKSQIAQLQLTVSQLKMDKNVLIEEVKEEQKLNQNHQQKIKKLQKEVKGKEMIQGENKQLKQAMKQQLEKNTQLKEDIAGLQTEYQKNYYDHLESIKQVEKLKQQLQVSRNEGQQANGKLIKLKDQLNQQSQSRKKSRQASQSEIVRLSAMVKEAETEAQTAKNGQQDEQQRVKSLQQANDEFLQRIQELEEALEQQQQKSRRLETTSCNYEGQNMILRQKNQHFQAQLQQLRQNKLELEQKVRQTQEQREQALRAKDEAVERMDNDKRLLKASVEQMENEAEKTKGAVQWKEQQIQQLKGRIEQSRRQEEIGEMHRVQLEETIGKLKLDIIDLNEKVDHFEQDEQSTKQHLAIIDGLLQNSEDPNSKVKGKEEHQQSRVSLVQELKSKKTDLEKEKATADQDSSLLASQVRKLKEQVESLKLGNGKKQEEIQRLRKEAEEMDRCLQESMGSMKEKLKQEETKTLVTSILSLGQKASLQKTKSTLEKYNDQVGSLTQQIQSALEEKREAIQKLNEMKSEQQKLEQSIGDGLKREKNLRDQCDEYRQQLKSKDQEVAKLSKETSTQQQSKQALKEQLQREKADGKETRREKQRLEMKVDELKQANNQLEEAITSLKEQVSQKEYEWEARERELRRSVDLGNQDQNEKLNKATLTVNEHKNRVAQLNTTLDKLRKQNYDLQTVAYSEKTNNAKLNNIISQLSNSLNKIEKAVNVKSYYMAPVRELIKKFEQVMQASDKMYIDFDRKMAKRESKDEPEKPSHSRHK